MYWFQQVYEFLLIYLYCSSVSVLVDVSGRVPRKLFMFFCKNHYYGKVIDQE